LKLHDIAILLFCVILAFCVVEVGTQSPAAGAPGQAKDTTKTTKTTKSSTTKTTTAKTTTTTTTKTKTTTSSNSVQWADLVKGGKLPYGGNVTLTGKLSDLTCGANPVSDVLNITAIAVSYLGQTSQAATATIATADSTWTAPLGSLPADTAVNLQLKITGNITSAKQGEIVDDLFADASFQRSLKFFLQDANGKSSADFDQDAQLVLNSIADSKSGALTKILQNLLPSCAVVTDVTTAAVKAFAQSSDLYALPQRVIDFGKQVDNLDGYSSTMTPSQLDAFIKAKNGKYTKNGGKPLTDDAAANGVHETKAMQDAANAFENAYQSVLAAFGGNVIAQLSQGVALTQSSSTQDLNKYAGFDAGALYAPRINELRGYYMVHIYPTGPVELDTSGHIPIWDRFSIAVGESTGDLSSNGASRVKGDKAFVYGLGVRINKYFRISAGGMVYRDAVGNRLLNEVFIGPSIDITALPGLKSVFASSSSKATTSTSTTSTTTATTSTPDSSGGSGAPQ
jgi:hypothetical protein